MRLVWQSHASCPAQGRLAQLRTVRTAARVDGCPVAAADVTATRILTWGALVLAVLSPSVVFLVGPALEASSTRANQERLREHLAESHATRLGDVVGVGDPVRRQKRGASAVVPVARAVAIGEPLGTIRVPRFGSEWEWVLLEGVADEVINNGPGRYPDTALPGERGNLGIAAHRAGHGDPFIDFDRLTHGDLVHITQGSITWTYKIASEPQIVGVEATWVLREHARQSGHPPKRQLTLTTCWPKYGSTKRMYVTAVLDSVEPAGSRT